MATQETGTLILARARVFAQDNAANSNYAVSDADALILLNDILRTFAHNVKAKPEWVPASSSGLTFAAGVAVKITTSDVGLGASEIESFHQSGTSSISYPLSPAIERVSVQQIMEMFDYDGDTAIGPQASEWTHIAAEKAHSDTAGGQERWRVWAYPVIDRTRYVHIRIPSQVSITALTDTPDIDTTDSTIISRFLAYEIAKLKKETTQAFLDNIIATVPKELKAQMYGAAVRNSQLQDHVIQRWS